MHPLVLLKGCIFQKKFLVDIMDRANLLECVACLIKVAIYLSGVINERANEQKYNLKEPIW